MPDVGVVLCGCGGGCALDFRFEQHSLCVFGDVDSSFLSAVIFCHDRFRRVIIRMMFFVQGVLMVYGGVASWTGLAVWNVPFNLEMFQVSMAFADLLGAVFLFVLAITEKVN